MTIENNHPAVETETTDTQSPDLETTNTNTNNNTNTNTNTNTTEADNSGVKSDAFAMIEKKLQAIQTEIQKAVIGQQEPIELILVSLLSGGHVLLEGVPGLGKTLMIKSLAKTFGGEFSRIQFTPDLMPADVTGHMLFNPKEGVFNLRKGPVFTNLLLADEINRAPAKTQAALLEVMQEKQVTIEGNSLEVKRPFMVLATQNPLEQEGTYPLPEAQLDRFLMKIKLDHLSAAEEQQLMGYILSLKQAMDIHTDEVAQVLTAEQLLKMQQATNKVTVDSRVIGYALDLVRKTRDFHGIAIGAGPRGGIALLACARAKALIAGRSHVLPDDIKALVLPVLRHRIALTADVEIEGLSADDVLNQLINAVDAPRQ